MRCAACGGTNPDAARWCNQCLAALAAPVPTIAEPAEDHPDVPERRLAATMGDGFRRRDGRVEWKCAACGGHTSLEQTACTVCGAPFSDRLRGDRGPAPEAPVGMALGLSALLPGAGHLAWRHYGSGCARALLYALWLSGGLALVGQPASQGAAVGAPLLLGAVALWVGSLIDVLALSSGTRQLLGGRALLWLVVGVTGLTLVGAVAAMGTVGVLA